jgi:hypothetical protein
MKTAIEELPELLRIPWSAHSCNGRPGRLYVETEEVERVAL